MSLKTPKLSKRLKAILNFVEPTTDFYDLCCDHGKLGIAVSRTKRAKFIHFVDPVERIINSLKENHHSENFFYYANDARDLKVKPHSCISIAGVGNHLGLEILKSLSDDPTLVFILNLNGLSLYVRAFLRENNFFLKEEILIFEKNQFFEILKVSKKGNEKISLLGGKSIWRPGDISIRYKAYLDRYLTIKLQHNKDKYLELCMKKLKIKEII